jgi:hypothetical protein
LKEISKIKLKQDKIQKQQQDEKRAQKTMEKNAAETSVTNMLYGQPHEANNKRIIPISSEAINNNSVDPRA